MTVASRARLQRLRREAFINERNEVLRSLNIKKLAAFMNKWRVPQPDEWFPDAQMIMMHKTRIALENDFTIGERLFSRQWLVERGYSTNRLSRLPEEQFVIQWHDLETKSENPANPTYPNGIAIDAANGAILTCVVRFEYPAKGCGQYMVGCRICGATAIVTTAGRADDPTSIRLPCRKKLLEAPNER